MKSPRHPPTPDIAGGHVVRRPRVGFLTTELGGGGAERVVFELARRISRERFDLAGVWCLAPATGLYAERLAEAGVPVFGAGIRGPAGLLPGLLRLRKSLRSARLDLLSAHLFHAGIAGRLILGRSRTTSLVVTHHLPDPRSWRYPVERLCPGRAARISAVSATVARKVADGLRLPREAVRVIPNGIDADAYERGAPGARLESRRRLGLPEDARVIGAVGRLADQKDPLTLLSAFALIARHEALAYLLLVGAGPLASQLRRCAEILGVEGRVIMPGFVPDVAGCFAAMDVFAMPSRYEGQGLALLEALAAGIPAVATRIPAFEETVGADGRAVLMVAPGDHRALASALRTILADRDLASRLAAAGRALVRERFSIQGMVDGYEAMFAETVPSPSA